MKVVKAQSIANERIFADSKDPSSHHQALEIHGTTSDGLGVSVATVKISHNPAERPTPGQDLRVTDGVGATHRLVHVIEQPPTKKPLLLVRDPKTGLRSIINCDESGRSFDIVRIGDGTSRLQGRRADGTPYTAVRYLDPTPANVEFAGESDVVPQIKLSNFYGSRVKDGQQILVQFEENSGNITLVLEGVAPVKTDRNGMPLQLARSYCRL